ncbi:CAP domain-containing protein [Aeromicrobium sp. Leaf350]|uniref:CAP domain-containing protein n=1 Tax=Aeromicrobium sp. Leaf350 TaxID=2876565 RepID=UPI001E5261EE|nr:CAP domain-containing protein [Aeromicrobium sp. Leaf350]
MMRRFLVAALAVTSLVLVGSTAGSATLSEPRQAASAAVTPTPAEQITPQVRQILDDTNAIRAQNGKPPVTLANELNVVAGNWTWHLHNSCTFAHNPSYASQIPAGWSSAAENIAAGQQPGSVVQAWIDSPGHRANLLGDFTHLGIGYVDGPSCYQRYFVQVFARY